MIAAVGVAARCAEARLQMRGAGAYGRDGERPRDAAKRQVALDAEMLLIEPGRAPAAKDDLLEPAHVEEIGGLEVSIAHAIVRIDAGSADVDINLGVGEIGVVESEQPGYFVEPPVEMRHVQVLDAEENR